MSKTTEVVEKENAIEKALEAKQLAPMKKVFAGVGELVTELSSITIKKPEDYDNATLALKKAKEISKKLEDAYDDIAAVPEKFVKSVKTLYNAINGPIDLGVKDLKRKMQEFQEAQEKKRQEEVAKLELKKQQEIAKIETADTAKEQQKGEVKVAKIEAKQEAIETYKPKTADKVRKFEVIDPDKVERKYCSPEDKKIRPFIGEVNGPIPEIPGVRIWDEFKIVNR